MPRLTEVKSGWELKLGYRHNIWLVGAHGGITTQQFCRNWYLGRKSSPIRREMWVAEEGKIPQTVKEWNIYAETLQILKFNRGVSMMYHECLKIQDPSYWYRKLLSGFGKDNWQCYLFSFSDLPLLTEIKNQIEILIRYLFFIRTSSSLMPPGPASAPQAALAFVLSLVVLMTGGHPLWSLWPRGRQARKDE